MINRIKLLVFLSVIVLSVSCAAFSGTRMTSKQKAGTNEPPGSSLEDCIRYSLHNSFEARLARLDLLIAETRGLYSESVFDTVAFGQISYSEDKRQPLSVFSGDDKQTNFYMGGVRKKIPTGTDLQVKWQDQRDWTNSSYFTRNPSHDAQLNLDARQPLLSNSFGFVDRNTITVTKLAIMNAGLEMRERIESLIAEVEKSYWRLVAAKLVHDITMEMLDEANRLHEVNSRNFNIGLIEKADLYASEANLRIRENDVMLAENDHKRARDDLKLLMNMDQEHYLSPSESFSLDPEEFDLAKCLATAFDNNRSYRIRKRDVEINDITLKMKGNQMWPELDLTGTFAMNGLEGKFNDAAGKTTVADNTYYYAGLELTMPLENSLARSEFQKASYEKERAIVSLKEKERAIITSVSNSFRTLATLNATVINMNEAVRLQAAKLGEEEKRFRFGRSSTKSLIDYQNDLLRARMSEARELLAREKARVDLEKEMSVLLEKYEDLI